MSLRHLFCVNSAFRIELIFINVGETCKAIQEEVLEFLSGIENRQKIAKKLSLPKKCFLLWFVLEWMGFL